MQNATGLPPYKIKFFNEIFYPLYQKKLRDEDASAANVVIEVESAVDKVSKLSDNVVPNATVTLTANEICDYYKLKIQSHQSTQITYARHI